MRHEYCETPEDFLARRTRMAFLDARAAMKALPRVGSEWGRRTNGIVLCCVSPDTACLGQRQHPCSPALPREGCHRAERTAPRPVALVRRALMRSGSTVGGLQHTH